MNFNIYVTTNTDDEALAALSEIDIVESGLSSGEFRQALLDRFRQELKTEDVYFVNFSLSSFGLEFDEDLVETAEGRTSILTDIENFLYDSDDEIFIDTLWDFHNETVYVRGEE